jgi:hypothetical protein
VQPEAQLMFSLQVPTDVELERCKTTNGILFDFIRKLIMPASTSSPTCSQLSCVTDSPAED